MEVVLYTPVLSTQKVHIMINCYSNLNVQIKWCGKYSTKINIHVGTREGRVSSPYLFNLFYQELIDLLSKCTGGIQIGEIHTTCSVLEMI